MNRSEHTIESTGGIVIHHFRKLLLGEIAMGCIGCALIAAAVTANQSWLDRHFLPAFFISRATFVMTEWVVRVVTGMIGLTLAVFARRKIACALSADWTRVLATL